MTLNDHRQGFAAAVAALVAEFNGYLERGQANPVADGVGYRQIPIWLSREELAGLVAEVTAALASRAANGPAPDRRLYLLSPILFPLEDGGHGATMNPS